MIKAVLVQSNYNVKRIFHIKTQAENPYFQRIRNNLNIALFQLLNEIHKKNAKDYYSTTFTS